MVRRYYFVKWGRTESQHVISFLRIFTFSTSFFIDVSPFDTFPRLMVRKSGIYSRYIQLFRDQNDKSVFTRESLHSDGTVAF